MIILVVMVVVMVMNRLSRFLTACSISVVV